jgi:hypothetical protein
MVLHARHPLGGTFAFRRPLHPLHQFLDLQECPKGSGAILTQARHASTTSARTRGPRQMHALCTSGRPQVGRRAHRRRSFAASAAHNASCIHPPALSRQLAPLRPRGGESLGWSEPTGRLEPRVLRSQSHHLPWCGPADAQLAAPRHQLRGKLRVLRRKPMCAESRGTISQGGLKLHNVAPHSDHKPLSEARALEHNAGKFRAICHAMVL